MTRRNGRVSALTSSDARGWQLRGFAPWMTARIAALLSNPAKRAFRRSAGEYWS